MKLYIEQGGQGPKKIAGFDTYVYVEDDEGNRVDISRMVRSAYVRLHLGEAVTANLEVYVTGFKGNAELEKLILKKMRKRRLPQIRGRHKDVTTFAHRDGARRFL